MGQCRIRWGAVEKMKMESGKWGIGKSRAWNWDGVALLVPSHGNPKCGEKRRTPEKEREMGKRSRLQRGEKGEDEIIMN